MRINYNLEIKLERIWSKYFKDVKKDNQITIKFGRKAVKRLGSIKTYKNGQNFDTLITINGYFKDKYIPDYIVDATIAHELCHYAHGFASPLPQLSRYPHRGGAVDKELGRRGLSKLVEKEKDWLDKYWLDYVQP